MNRFHLSEINIQPVFLFLGVSWLPLALVLLFTVQNQAFNNWIGLGTSVDLGRLLMVSVSLGVIIYGPAIFFKKPKRYGYLAIASAAVSVLFIAQYLNFQYSESFLQVSALRYANQAPAILGTVASLLSAKILLFLSGFLLVIVAFFTDKKQSAQSVVLGWKGKIMLGMVMVLLGVFGYAFLIHQEDKEWGNASRLYTDVYDVNGLVKKVGIVNFFLEDAVKYLLRANLVSAQDQTFLQNFGKSESLHASPTKKQYTGIAKGKNIIFIQVESLENALIYQKINGQEITPNLNELAREGLYFSNYYTQVGPGNTADAEFSTLDSLYPLPDDVVFVDYAQNTYEALPKVAAAAGYGTYSFHGDVKTFWNRSNIYPNLGYQNQFSEEDYTKSRSVGKGPSDLGDEDFFLQTLPKLERIKQPFFSTLITMSSHTPFELPQDLQTMDLSGAANLTYTQQQYIESVHYMDMALGEFMQELKKTDLYEHSVIAIYGDHGSFTGISDALGAGDNAFSTLRHSQVPLILLVPGTKIVASTDIPASHLDLFPTIANLVGMKTPKSVLGQDILNTKTPVVTIRNLISGTINTIITPQLGFLADNDGEFEKGLCYRLPSHQIISVDECKSLYDQQNELVKASDIIVRGNLLNAYTASFSH